MASSMPVEMVFAPNWWLRHYGIAFDRPFYFDPEVRIANDLAMGRALYDRFGLGEPGGNSRPIIGSMHVAGGFVVPALLGVETRFSSNQAPWPVPCNLSGAEVMRLRVPQLETTWPMNVFITQMDALEREAGFVVGDFNTDGVLNTALQMRGEQLFLDLVEDPPVADHLFTVIAETQVRVARYMRERTGTCSIAVNRSIINVDPGIYLHANCSMQMVSPTMFRDRLLKYECRFAAALPPYGVHHCGKNLHLFVKDYLKAGAVFFDVGWGSDIAKVRAAAPNAFLNLRLSPIRMRSESSRQIREDVERMIRASGGPANAGICCMNMDEATPDANVIAAIESARACEFAAQPH
jgi:uroporphyrinogen decarboxylase-like protein